MEQTQRPRPADNGYRYRGLNRLQQTRPVKPPLEEQRRTVAKVDELMAVLAALEAARTSAESLLAATIAKLGA